MRLQFFQTPSPTLTSLFELYQNPIPYKLFIAENMEGLPIDVDIEVEVTTNSGAFFEDYLSNVAEKEKMAAEETSGKKKTDDPEQPEASSESKAADLSKEIEQPEDHEDGQRMPPMIHAVTGLDIPYPPGAETASLFDNFEFEFGEDVSDLVARADRITLSSTAEIAANSPRYRRRSSTFIDGVHDLPNEDASPMAPAQLYSTMSGRLFHSGRIAIVLVGPPARGKT